MNVRQWTIAIAAAVGLMAIPAIPRPALGGHDRPASKSGGTADLRLTIKAPDRISEGDKFLVEYSAVNDGPNLAQGVKLTSSFDSSRVAFVEGYRCSGSGNTVTCAYEGELYSGSTVSFQVFFRALTSGVTFDNSATVSAQTKDPNTSNNSASVSVPIVFEYGCEGTVRVVASPVSHSYPYPPDFYSCGRSSSLASARVVRLDLTPQTNFGGSLSAELRSGGTLVARISATFVAGQAVFGTPSTTVTLPAGNWHLDVFAGAINTYFQTGPRCIVPQLSLCTPYIPMGQGYLYVPMSYGSFGARITQAGS